MGCINLYSGRCGVFNLVYCFFQLITDSNFAALQVQFCVRLLTQCHRWSWLLHDVGSGSSGVTEKHAGRIRLGLNRT